MRVIIVDDERLALRQFEMETEDMPGVEVAGAFTNPVDALAYVQEHPVEAAFLDIAMPGMNGLALAEKLREIRPDLVVIFLTGYEQYTLDALKVKADYYLTKPYNKQDITEALERARLLAARQKKRVYARTFGRFDVFIDGEAVYFPNAKAKELLALCVDHRGGAVTIEEAVDKLWENRAYDDRVKNLYRKAVMQIRQVLAEHGAEALFPAAGEPARSMCGRWTATIMNSCRETGTRCAPGRSAAATWRSTPGRRKPARDWRILRKKCRDNGRETVDINYKNDEEHIRSGKIERISYENPCGQFSAGAGHDPDHGAGAKSAGRGAGRGAAGHQHAK